MAWETELEYVKGWLNEQDVETQLGTYAALEVLAQQGSALGRPPVDTQATPRLRTSRSFARQRQRDLRSECSLPLTRDARR